MLDIKTLKTLLDNKGIKQAQLSRMTNIPRNSMCRYLSGEVQPKADKIKLLADALGVSMESLLIMEIPNRLSLYQEQSGNYVFARIAALI